MEPASSRSDSAALETDERRADVNYIANLGEQALDSPRDGRGYFDESLGCLDRDQRLVDGDVLPQLHTPFHEFRLLQALAEVG